MKPINCIIIAIVIFTACAGKTTCLEQALDFAGVNRMELEKVLVHYSTDPADSLRYRTACFLIENYGYNPKGLTSR